MAIPFCGSPSAPLGHPVQHSVQGHRPFATSASPSLPLSLSPLCHILTWIIAWLLDVWLRFLFARQNHTRFALHSFRDLANFFTLATAGCTCDCSNLTTVVMQIKVAWTFADVPHVLGREQRSRAAVCCDPVVLNSSVKQRVFKWPARKAGIGAGIACVKPQFIPRVYNPGKEGHWYEKAKHSNLLGARPRLYLTTTFQQRSRGTGGRRVSEDREGEREAGIKSACWKKQDGHKRWTKLQRRLFLSKANGNISTQHRAANGGSIITAKQTELAAIPERSWDAACWPGLAPSASPSGPHLNNLCQQVPKCPEESHKQRQRKTLTKQLLCLYFFFFFASLEP